MYYFQARRVFRQWLRSYQTNTKRLTYAQYTRRHLLIVFPFFYIGWNVVGGQLFMKAFWRRDEETGEERWFKPDEVKKMVANARKTSDGQLFEMLGFRKNTRPPVEISKVRYPLDDAG